MNYLCRLSGDKFYLWAKMSNVQSELLSPNSQNF
jgi:hypothetical protein